MTRLRRLPPAGSPIGARDLRAWAVTAAREDDPVTALAATVGARVGVPHCRITCTGRAGLTLLLQALRRLAPPRRTEVIVPSYTCFSVPAAVVKAGLTPRLGDVVPQTLDYAYDRLARTDFSRVLAIVATNLYGFPNDLPRLSALARAHNVFLVDDAAQALGARVGGRPSGTWGDAGLYSFDKGKNIAAMDGGAIVSHLDSVIEALDANLAGLDAPPRRRVAVGIVKAVVYAAFLKPSVYWLPQHVPGLGLGRTRYTTAFALELPARALAALALSVFGHLDRFAAARHENARRLLARLAGLPGIQPVEPIEDAEPAYLRLPLLVSDPETRARIIAAVNRAVGGATASYPTSIADIPELQGQLAGGPEDAVGGRAVASRIVTLPTHPLVGRRDVDRLVAAVAATVRGMRSGATVPVSLYGSAR